METQELCTVKLTEDRRGVVILDQTLLPGQVAYRTLSTPEEIWEAIRALRVRGAPAIGVAAAYGVCVCAAGIDTADMDLFFRRFGELTRYLCSARPTAVNLPWALERMEKTVEAGLSCMTVAQLKERLYQEADAIREEDEAICRTIGRLGAELLHPGDGILTHCNAGALATSKYGTALAPVYTALERGRRDLRVYCDETRPLLQGARLTALELTRAGVDTTLICDDMASWVMKQGKVDIVFVGCDRVASNGDFANKIGTSGVAILASYYHIPFYVCAPSSTIDPKLSRGSEIVIEERPPEEVTTLWYAQPMAPAGVKVENPAFDVTDHSLVTGIITERGIAYPPFDRAFQRLGLT